jgi:hypothetical protein
MLELAGQDVVRGYADSRGFGMLADGAFQHLPVPGNILAWYGRLPTGQQPYSYGGVTNEGCNGTTIVCEALPGSAKYAPVD